jgi:very-long-chain (3R)-3-hydroxyacyl-CoA dehydratase
MTLGLCIRHLLQRSSPDALWADIEKPIKIVQTAAVLEALHSMVGLVRSPWATCLLQVFSRLYVLWCIMAAVPAAELGPFLMLGCLSWCCVEVPRYMYYALNLLDEVPYALTWLRYSLFGVLYPTGITGEIGCTYFAALYMMAHEEQYRYTFALGGVEAQLQLWWLLAGMTLLYVPGAPTMYGHMVSQRRKVFKALDAADAQAVAEAKAKAK